VILAPNGGFRLAALTCFQSGTYGFFERTRNLRFYTLWNILATVLHYDCGYSQRRCVKTMASGQKKVVIRRFAGALAWGYLPQNGLAHEDQVHLMAVDGRITPISFNEIKTIAYVHDFNLDDPVDAERIGRRSFAARPRGEGLWLRLTFQDADSIEGVAEVSLNLLDT
jgi:hypothetical protein